MNAFEAAPKNGKADDLYKQLVDLAISQNKSNGKVVSIPAIFMRVTVNL